MEGARVVVRIIVPGRRARTVANLPVESFLHMLYCVVSPDDMLPCNLLDSQASAEMIRCSVIDNLYIDTIADEGD